LSALRGGGKLRSVRLVALTVSFLLPVLVWGCGGGSKHSSSTSAGQPSTQVAESIPTVHCETAMGGAPSRSWRRGTTSSGPVGFFGTGRNFLKASAASGYYKRQWEGALLETKTPLIAAGKEPVTISVAPRDRSHARLQAPTSPPWAPQVEIRFAPCGDQARTIWAAGFLLRNRSPVTLIVLRSGDPERRLRVGRV